MMIFLIIYGPSEKPSKMNIPFRNLYGPIHTHTHTHTHTHKKFVIPVDSFALRNLENFKILKIGFLLGSRMVNKPFSKFYPVHSVNP